MKHRCKEQKRMIQHALEQGFRSKAIRDGEMLFPPDQNCQPFTLHYGERGLHDLRRYLKKYFQNHKQHI
jgi:hypothetical protein